jgi:predicted nucleic acid-binding protein
MSDRFFCDSNIFLYAFSKNKEDIDKKKIASDIVNQRAVISTQVINEVSNNMLKKLNFDNTMIEKFTLNCFERYEIVNFSKPLYQKACKLRDNYNFSYYDSLIVSAALIWDCTTLYSEDMQNGLKVEQLIIINPFEN